MDAGTKSSHPRFLPLKNGDSVPGQKNRKNVVLRKEKRESCAKPLQYLRYATPSTSLLHSLMHQSHQEQQRIHTFYTRPTSPSTSLLQSSTLETAGMHQVSPQH